MFEPSKFISLDLTQPPTLKFKNGCRLKWVDKSYGIRAKVVRCGGVWFYISTSKAEQAEGCYGGEQTGCSDAIYAEEVMQGFWTEF